MPVRSALINVMMAAAEKAGRRLGRDFGEVEQLQGSRKGPADFVSIADRQSEETLFTELKRARPTYGFLLEERGEIAGSDTSNRWIVDPLDGTTNYLHGIPHFAISIGLERDGQPFAGVIFNPVSNDMYWAERGQGAHLNDRRLRVSARRDLSESLFATGIPFKGTEGHEPFLRQLRAVMQVASGVRRMGAAALDLAFVAAGRYEGYWEGDIRPWDIAAGIIMVREAGGFVTDLAGGKEMMTAGTILATNDSLQATVAKVLREAGA